MVATYIGKIDYAPYSVNTIITVVVPDAIEEGHTCLIYWQWTKDVGGVPNHNCKFQGQFRSLVLE